MKFVTVSSTVSQITLLSFSNSLQGHSQLTASSNFIIIYPNLFEFILNFVEFCRICEKRSHAPGGRVRDTKVLVLADKVDKEMYYSAQDTLLSWAWGSEN